MKRRIAPAILIFACLALGGMAFMRLQANVPRIFPSNLMPAPAMEFDVPASDAVRDEAENAILGQLNAFRSNDFAKAESYQSHMYGSFVGTPAEFHDLMVHTCPELVHYRTVAFGAAMTDPSQMRVIFPATITGQDGARIFGIYMLSRDEDGVFRVFGFRQPEGGMRRPMEEMPY